VETLVRARSIAQDAGLHYVYVGNCAEVENAETTFCPGCKKAVVERHIYRVTDVAIENGKCRNCGTQIDGVWSA